MNFSKTQTSLWKQLLRRGASLLLGVSLFLSVTLSYAHVAQASPNTTSAASRADADRISQRKEDASHYPNWYDDQRSLESYMDEQGMSGIGSDGRVRTDGQNNRDDENHLIDRAEGTLKGMVDTVRDAITPDSSSSQANFRINNYENYREEPSAGEIPERIKSAFEGARDTFQGANPSDPKSGNYPLTKAIDR